jgi:hypothetical protein
MATPTDSLGVEIRVGDRVRVLAYGAPVRRDDVGQVRTVKGFSPRGNVSLARLPYEWDPVAGGRNVSPGMLGVLRRDGTFDGYEGNRDLYSTD